MQPIAENIFNLHLRRFILKKELKTVLPIYNKGPGKAIMGSKMKYMLLLPV